MRHGRGITLAVMVAVLGAATLVHAEPANRVDKVSSSDFARTVQQLETALKGKGMMTIAANPESGLEMPGRIYVWERGDGKTVASYYRAAPAFAAYGKENLKMAGEMMDTMLAEIVIDATK